MGPAKSNYYPLIFTPLQRTIVSDNAPIGDTRVLKRSISLGYSKLELVWGRGGEEAREQIESGRVFKCSAKDIDIQPGSTERQPLGEIHVTARPLPS